MASQIVRPRNPSKAHEMAPTPFYMEIILKEEVNEIVARCIEVWKILGYGFSEIVYKDAMEEEFLENQIPYLREPALCVFYKSKALKHKFNSDFTVFGKIIVEVKSGETGIVSATTPQALHYIKATGFRIGLIINFGKTKLDFKRLIM